MNDLRTAAQQALEALKWHLERGAYGADIEGVTGNLRAALSQQAKAETCTWQQDGDSESSVYATSCRRYFSLDDGTPEDNKMAWCCFCGKKLVQEMITEEDGND